MVTERDYDEYIGPRRQMVVVNVIPMFQWAREATHGPHEEWPGMRRTSAWKFLHDVNLAWRRFHAHRRPNVPEHVLEQFLQQARDLMTEVPIDDILNADETNWILNALRFYTRAPRGCVGVQVATNANTKQSFTVMATVTMRGP
jgi:hypothetical protein